MRSDYLSLHLFVLSCSLSEWMTNRSRKRCALHTRMTKVLPASLEIILEVSFSLEIIAQFVIFAVGSKVFYKQIRELELPLRNEFVREIVDDGKLRFLLGILGTGWDHMAACLFSEIAASHASCQCASRPWELGDAGHGS